VRMAQFDLGDGVVHLRLVGIDRGREANPIVGSVADGLLVELSEVAEYLDELEADRMGRDEELLEVAIELRLPADEPKLAAAKGRRPRA
jgi:hypothetical protein